MWFEDENIYLHRTPPERTRAALEANYGNPRGHPDEFLVGVAAMFVEELCNGQRACTSGWVTVRGVGWDTARSGVMSAVKRGHLIWTGTDREPAGHQPGQEPWDPPGSFEHMYNVLELWVKQQGHARVPKARGFGGVKLGLRVQAVRERYRQGTLSKESDGWRR